MKIQIIMLISIIIRNTKFICYYLVRTREGDILIHSNAYERFNSCFYELTIILVYFNAYERFNSYFYELTNIFKKSS